MRFVIALILLSLTTFEARGQDFERVYLYTKFRDYHNAKLKFDKDLYSVYLKYQFHGSLENAVNDLPSDLYNSESEKEFIESIKEVEFTVVGFYQSTGDTLEADKEEYNPIFMLKGNDGKKYFWKYSANSEGFFKCIRVSLDQGDVNYCEQIEVKKDDFTKEVSWHQPYHSNNDPSFSAYQRDGKINVYMSLRTTGVTLNVEKKGLYLLFEGDTVVHKPEVEIKTDVADEGWSYSAFFELNKDEMKLLADKKLLKYRLYIYDDEVKANNRLRDFAKCFLEKFD